MCVVSMIGDFYHEKWEPYYPIIIPYIPQPGTPVIPSEHPPQGISREEYEQLRREVQDLKELLRRAKEYDKKNEEPDCEMESKIEMIQKMAKFVGVNLEDVLKKKPGGSAT